MEKMKENGVKIPVVEESLMHMIYTGFFSSVFQIIEHDIDRETAKKNVHQLKEFNTGGWERLWNIEFITDAGILNRLYVQQVLRFQSGYNIRWLMPVSHLFYYI